MGIVKNIFTPLAITEVLGNYCCTDMYHQQKKALLLKSSLLAFDSPSLMDTNVLILWGSFSKKLILTIEKELKYMPAKKALIHMRGCNKRIDNAKCFSNLSDFIAFNIIFSQCTFNYLEAKNLIRDIKTCLKA